MEQIAVTKIETLSNGEKAVRNMMLPKNIWEDIVQNGSGNANVEWKLRAIEPIVTRSVEIIGDEFKVKESFAAPDDRQEQAPEQKISRKSKRGQNN